MAREPKPTLPTKLGEPLYTEKGLREALLMVGVIPGKITREDVRDFALSQTNYKKQIINQSR